MSDTSSALTVIDSAMTEALQLSRDAVNATLTPYRRAMAQAGCLRTLRQVMTDHPEVTETLKSLQGSALGFLTDKDKAGGYPANILADCAIEAMARGLSLAGNEFNIISGRCYVTKAGMKRLLADMGIKHAVTCGLPKIQGEVVTVPVDIMWEYAGEQKSKHLDIPTRQNSGMGVEALQGKATRKARAWLYELITGLDIADGDTESAAETARAAKSPIIDVQPTPAASDSQQWAPVCEALKPYGIDMTTEEMADIIARLNIKGTPPAYMAEHAEWLANKIREGI